MTTCSNCATGCGNAAPGCNTCAATAPGSIEKEIGMARATQGKEGLVQAAQTIARRLGRDGAVTIDDVVYEMRKMGYASVGPGSKDAPKNWKGSVFSTGEWVCTGSIQSRESSAHGRQVRQWCLKSWLREHPVNGTDGSASAFSLFRLYDDAIHAYPDGRFDFIVGRDTLAAGIASSLSGQNPTLFGKGVKLVDGIGAICARLRGYGQD